MTKHAEYARRHVEKKRLEMGDAAWLAYRSCLNKAWIVRNRGQYNKAKSLYRFSVKMEVLRMYSSGEPHCASCGFSSDVDALCLDHINDNGAEHRKLLGISSRGSKSGTTIYERIKAKGKLPGLQVLCANCNAIKELRRKRGGQTSADVAQSCREPRRWKRAN